MNKEAMTPDDLKHVEKLFEENDQIRGHLAHLSEGRLVFIGEHPDANNCWCIAFRNEAGDDTRIKLSKEAMAILVQLYNRKPNGMDVFPLRIRMPVVVTIREPEDSLS